MRIVLGEEIKALDAETIANEPISSIDLMERVAVACTAWILKRFEKDVAFVIVAGPGNNGGDGLAIARLLRQEGYQISVLLVGEVDQRSEDCAENLARLSSEEIQFITDLSKLAGDIVIIDALLGIGLNREVKGAFLTAIESINGIGNVVISIDIPSGLNSEGIVNNDVKVVAAKFTLTLEMPKQAFMYCENEKVVGAWDIIPIGLDKSAIDQVRSRIYLINQDIVASRLNVRGRFSHKGDYGKALMIAGQKGMMGAAVLACKAGLKSGVGLLTAGIPDYGFGILHTAVPEAMCLSTGEGSYSEIFPSKEKWSAIGVGPGIGTESETERALKLLIQNYKGPLLLDADALNILAENTTWLGFLNDKTILTPHVGEFRRLVGNFDDSHEMIELQKDLSLKHGIYVVLKGAHTSITCPDGTLFFNSTGNPGMATAGSGDVLSGLITGLLAQGYSCRDASIIGVYAHGLAGDLALQENSWESVLASDIIDHFGVAFESIRNFCRLYS